MRRRTLIAGVFGAIVGLALSPNLRRPALAQDSGRSGKARIGFVSWWPPSMRAHAEALRDGLREYGYVEGKTFEIEAHFTSGNRERTREVIRGLLERAVDVLVVSATPAAHIAKEATRTVPIVLAPVADPLATGLVQSLARPGGNITGLTSTGPDLAGKRLELLREMKPDLKAIAFLGSSIDQNTGTFVRGTRAAADRLGIKLTIHLIAGPERIDAGVFEAMRHEGAEALIVQPVFTGSDEKIVGLATEARIVAVGQYPSLAEAGGLMSLGIDDVALMRRAAYYVDRILRGADPALLPIEQPTKFTLVINARTAKLLGWKIPESLEIRADRIIE